MKHISKILILILIFMTSCSSTGSREFKTPDKQAKEIEVEIINCIEQKDAETLKSLFCSYIINNHSDLDAKIKEVFEFFDGEIVSYDGLTSSACGSREHKDCGASANVTTDKGTVYSIAFKAWLTNEDYSDKIGVNALVVKNESASGMSEVRISEVSIP